jgi:alanyl aminopeptidase
VASQRAPIHARAVFPSFDEPRFKGPFDISVTTRTDDVVITNAPQAATEARGNGRVRHIFATTEPLPTYLVAVAVGPYDVVTWDAAPSNAVRSWELPLRGIAVRGQGGGLTYALSNTANLLEAIENYFDTPYPYAKLDFIAVPSSIGGAMENAGAITYDEFLVLMDDDSPVTQRRTYTYIHAHELAHMWFGDWVTPAWWTDSGL